MKSDPSVAEKPAAVSEGASILLMNDALRSALDPSYGELLLACGEMTAQELRSIRAVLKWTRLRALAAVERIQQAEREASPRSAEIR